MKIHNNLLQIGGKISINCQIEKKSLKIFSLVRAVRPRKSKELKFASKDLVNCSGRKETGLQGVWVQKCSKSAANYLKTKILCDTDQKTL